MKNKVEVDYNKGTNYRRKQEDNIRASKQKKRSKRLAPYGESERAKCSNLLHQYMSEDDFDDEY